MISIILTCYNYGDYVGDAIGSALKQSYTDFEVIVVNDGSTDNSEEVISRFLDDPRIKYIKQKNAGQANAKNTGIKNAARDLIAFLDADDMWEPDKLAKQVKLFNNPNVGVVYSRARYIDGDGNPLDLRLQSKYLQPRSGKVTEWLIFDNFVPFSSSVVRRECFEKIGLFDESLKMGIDWDLWLRISVHYEFDYINEPLLIYRVGHSGQMSKNIEVRQQCSDRIYEKFLSAHREVLPEETIRAALHYTYCSRGYYFRQVNRRKALLYYLKALAIKPFSSSPYKGIIRTALPF